MNNQTALYKAIINGDKKKILVTLKNDIDLKTTDEDGDTFLHVAFRNEKFNQAQLIEILKIFLDRGMDINAKNNFGKTVLQKAVERRMRDVVDFCLKRNADPNLRHRRGNSIAHFAIEEECRKFVRYEAIEKIERQENESSSFIDWMVSRGIDFFHTRNIARCSALSLAINLNLQHVVLSLLKRITDWPPTDENETPILCAFLEIIGNPDAHSRRQNLKPIHPDYYKSRYAYDIVKIILEKDKYIDDQVLIMAAHSALTSDLELKVIDVLLQSITSLDTPCAVPLLQTFVIQFAKWTRYSSTTSLFTFYLVPSLRTSTNELSELKKQSEIKDAMGTLRTLIQKRPDLNQFDRKNDRLSHSLFCFVPSLEMLVLLKDAGVDFSARTNCGASFLQLIIQHSNVNYMVDETKMIDLVLNNGCDVNTTNFNGETPLQLAIICSNDVVARRLIERGANVNVVDKNGRSPLSLACAWRQSSIAEKLIEHGADLGYKDEDDKTLLHFATRCPKVVELLLKNGANVNAKDRMGKTPLHYAELDPVVKELVGAGGFVDVLDKQGCSPLYDSLFRETYTFEELLTSGAEIQDPKVCELLHERFQRAYDTYNIIDSSMYLKEHFVKLIAAGLLDKITYILNGIEEVLQQFFEQSLAEAELLKTFFIDDCTSLYNLLHKNRNRICAYVDNEKLKAFVKDVSLHKKFPNYSVLILGYYNKAVRRNTLLESAVYALNEVAETLLPDLCTDKIFTHLSNIDLMCFVDACEF